MTEHASRRRASRRELRVWAWIAGGLAFLAPWAALGASPKPAAQAAGGARPVVVVRKITRRIVVTHPTSPAPVRYVTSGSPSSSSSGGGSVSAAPATTSTGSS